MRNNKFKTWWENFKTWQRNTTKIKYIFLVYFLIVLVFSLILFFPWTQKDNANVNYGDAVFTTASAFSDTGLVTKVTQETWNMFGQAVIATLIFVGGIGFFALKVFIINYLFRAKFDLSQRELLNTERGDENVQTSKLVISSIKFIIGVLLVGGIGLTIYFYFVPAMGWAGSSLPVNNNPYHNFSLSARFGFFHAISALNNAGFDIMGKNSLAPYYYNIDLQIIIIILFVIGGIGYPVIYDFIKFVKFKYKNRQRYYKWSLISKVSVSTYLIVSLVGFIVVLMFEGIPNTSFWNDPTYGSGWHKTWALFFTTFSTRSAGFATIDLHHLSSGTLIIFALLMFIGAAPASTGGGIRTTTMAIIIISIISRMIGHKSTRLFKRKINDDTVKMSSNVFMISFIFILIGTLILHSSLSTYNGSLPTSNNQSQRHYDSVHLLFEVASAFGTTGLSTGITANLNWTSKITLIIIMFIGQFGVSSTILVWKNRNSKSNKYEFLEENIAIG